MADSGSPSSNSSVSDFPRSRNPFTDSHAALSHTSPHRGKAAQVPHSSSRPSVSSSASSSWVAPRAKKHKFASYRLRDKYEQPWLDDKRLKAWKRNNYIIYGAIVVAAGVCGFLGFWGTKRGVPKHDVSFGPRRVCSEHEQQLLLQ